MSFGSRGENPWPIILAFQRTLLIEIELISSHLFLTQTEGQLGEEYYSIWPFQQSIQRCLSMLIENDYIRMEIQERSKGTAIYRTTDKGIALLRIYQHIRDLIVARVLQLTIGSLIINPAYLCGITCRISERSRR